MIFPCVSIGRPLALLGLCLCGLLLPGRASAQSCTTTTSPTINFGSVDVLSGVDPAVVSSSITVKCTAANKATDNFKVCLSIGGASGTTPRVMANGSNLLQYNLYSDSAHTQIWGSIFSGNPTGVNDLTLTATSGGSATLVVPIYAYMQVSLNTTLPAGVYQQDLTNSQVALNYSYSTGTPATCSTGGNNIVIGSFGFTPTATVINNCYVTTAPVNFGSATTLGGSLTANGAIKATCTMSDSYTIKLNAGGTSGATLADRRMQGPGTNVAHYQLYTNSGLTTVWGDGTSSTSTVTGTGNATQQSYTVYGRVQSQTTPAPGSYSDAVTVTVTY